MVCGGHGVIHHEVLTAEGFGESVLLCIGAFGFRSPGEACVGFVFRFTSIL